MCCLNRYWAFVSLPSFLCEPQRKVQPRSLTLTPRVYVAFCSYEIVNKQVTGQTRSEYDFPDASVLFVKKQELTPQLEFISRTRLVSLIRADTLRLLFGKNAFFVTLLFRMPFRRYPLAIRATFVRVCGAHYRIPKISDE